MKKHPVIIMAVTIALVLTACGNTELKSGEMSTELKTEDTVASEETSKIESLTTETVTEQLDQSDTEEPKAPQKEEVTAMRELVLEGMSEEQISALCSVIKEANHTIEWAALYNNFFEHLSDPDDLTWNYFDHNGEIQIGWAYDGEMPIQEVMEKENLTENEVYAKYGSEVVTNNQYSAEDFAQILEKYRDAVTNDALRSDLQQLIDETRLAAETHDVVHVENLYHILHDMDYYLLNYRLDTEGQVIRDKSTISKYYGVLSVYAELQD